MSKSLQNLVSFRGRRTSLASPRSGESRAAAELQQATHRSCRRRGRAPRRRSRRGPRRPSAGATPASARDSGRLSRLRGAPRQPARPEGQPALCRRNKGRPQSPRPPGPWVLVRASLAQVRAALPGTLPPDGAKRVSTLINGAAKTIFFWGGEKANFCFFSRKSILAFASSRVIPIEGSPAT